MAKKLYIDQPVKSAKDRIIRLKTAGDVVLTAAEELILLRWEYADQLMRTHHSYTEVTSALQERFGVSRNTADKDYAATQEVFAKARSINRKYEGGIHLDRINRMIIHYEGQLYKKDQDGQPALSAKQQKELGAIITKLYENYTYQLNSIPADEGRQQNPVPNMIFKFAQNNFQAPMTAKEAIQALGDYLEFDDYGANTDGIGDATSAHAN